MKTCKYKNDMLMAYCYKELNDEKMKEVEGHLNLCVGCTTKVKEIQNMLTASEQQAQKEIPPELLANYTKEIREKISKMNQQPAGILFSVREKISDFAENIRFILSPRMIAAVVTVCLAMFVFTVVQNNRIDTAGLVEQDTALFSLLDENIDEIFLASNDDILAEEIEQSDLIVLAQLDEDMELEDFLSDLELLEELGEEGFNGDEAELLIDLELLDDIEIESSVG